VAAKSKFPTSEPIDLVQSIEYAEGFIVSNTLADHKTGSLIVFSFDAGQGLSEHTSPYEAVVQILDGEAEWTVGGKAHTVISGQWIVLPAKVPHGVQAKSRFKMLLTMIHS
jgi:quercetin dioxygenase-like cupin family protein